MSQLLSQKEDPIYISTSIAKFSHNTCPLGTRSFTWTHTGARNDIDFIVRRTRVVDEHGNFNERLVMKITAGAELLVMAALCYQRAERRLTDTPGKPRSWSTRSAMPCI